MAIPFIGGRGQTEVIRRGERTDPLTIVKQALWGAIVSSAIFASLLALILVSVHPPWRWYTVNWRWLVVAVFFPWPIWALCAAIQLFVEVFDPNHPATRQAAETTKPIYPWSKERKPAPKVQMPRPDYLIFGDDKDG